MPTNIYTYGVDPGNTGRWLLLKNGSEVITYGGFFFDSDNKVQFKELDKTIAVCRLEGDAVYIEHPWTQGNQGGTETIWRNYQSIFLAFSTNTRQPIEIRPQTWQASLGLSITKEEKKLGMTTAQKRELMKQKSHDFAKSKCPDLDLARYSEKTGKVLTGFNDGLADAFCIAYYGYLQENLNSL